jgi:hypothetical protein
MSAAQKINDANYGVYADGEHVGWVINRTIGSERGWHFVAADKRFTNRFPDSVSPAATWQAAMPSAA